MDWPTIGVSVASALVSGGFLSAFIYWRASGHQMNRDKTQDYFARFQKQIESAEKQGDQSEIERTIEVDPNYAYGDFSKEFALLLKGEFYRALEDLKRQRRWDTILPLQTQKFRNFAISLENRRMNRLWLALCSPRFISVSYAEQKNLQSVCLPGHNFQHGILTPPSLDSPIQIANIRVGLGASRYQRRGSLD